MPRKRVPAIDGCLCEIKEKLKALYDRTHACILRINGKTPDGNGDITLDLSDAIPGRYVESVNGQDGNVIIDKASVGLSNVDNVSSSQILNQADTNNQSRLEAFEAAKLDPIELEVTANSGRIIQLEGQQVVLDDKMEQTIQYVDAIGDDVAEIKDAYVDKTTTQYITGKKFIPTPTAGEYSGIAVNKAYVESTDGVTNNLVHTIGNESVNGKKTIIGHLEINGTYSNKTARAFVTNTAPNRWTRLYHTGANTELTHQVLMFVITGQKGNSEWMSGLLIAYLSGNNLVIKDLTGHIRADEYQRICAVHCTDGRYEIWGDGKDGNNGFTLSRLMENNWGAPSDYWTVDGVTRQSTFDPTDTSKYTGYGYIRGY